MSDAPERRYADPAYPAWIREIDLALPVKPQIILTGNVRDQHVLPLDHPRSPALVGTVDIVVDCLVDNGFQLVLLHDPIDGLQVAYEATEGLAAKTFGGVRSDQPTPVTMTRLAQTLREVVTATPATALVMDYASRLQDNGQPPDPDVQRLFAQAEKAAHTATANNRTPRRRTRLFNPVLWLVDREVDLPHWLTAAQQVAVVSVPVPTLDTRRAAAERLARSLPGFSALDSVERDAAVTRFAELTQGMALRSLADVAVLAVDGAIPAQRLGEAVRLFRAGLPDSPWLAPGLRERIAHGTETVAREVLGQDVAVRKSLDILIRAATGLTGSHAKGHPGRPQGILFFAGPTGVGKTELATQLARLVFGTREALVRFDMSEFSAEHTEARLIGAPPGFVGHDAGGELTNAVRERPFSLLLFDEVEKAHPRILDKFLQILEDGRLTDGSGSTVYFSETIIVFTSNLGLVRTTAAGKRELLVQPGEPYTEIEARVRSAVGEHLRPELLNRIGENNVVVFDFISPDVGTHLVDKYVGNVIDHVKELRGIDVTLTERARQQLTDAATADLQFGGRGIGNAVENAFTNPLARALFERTADGPVTVTGTEHRGGVWRVILA